jgi:phage tail-like protein
LADPAAVGQHYAGKFVFEVDGLEIGAFQEVSGLSVQVEVQTIEEGGLNDYVHQLPGRMKWPNLKLKRGVTDSDALFEWLNKSSGEGLAGGGYKLERSTGRISLLDASYTPVRTWEFEGAFPVKWTGPSLSASNNDVAVEELEIAHHGFRSSG